MVCQQTRGYVILNIKKEFNRHLTKGPIHMVSRIHLTKIEPLEKKHQVLFQIQARYLHYG